MLGTKPTQEELCKAYQSIRGTTENLCQPLAIEDYVIQSIEDVSPPKWHLAHTTWFFETFLLIPYLKNYAVYNPLFHYLFNSYYQHFGHPYPRVQRGLLSRPKVTEIYAYRAYVDKFILELLNQNQNEKIHSTLILGLHHEQQHQELLLMDIKHNFSLHPDYPAYQSATKKKIFSSSNADFIFVSGGLVTIGYQGENFCFDNELPPHQCFLQPYSISTKLVTNKEYLEFVTAGGYQEPKWWLSDGWDAVVKNQWHAPLYWLQQNNKWYQFTLNGLKELDLEEPTTHVSFYEADAYARFREKRLPRATEWEYFVTSNQFDTNQGNFLESHYYHPKAKENHNDQFFGDVWEWTASAYHAYPGFKPLAGAIGEYNGKFMSNQIELRGGSCVTPKTHIRASYRNFFQPDKRWQFSGIRLAE